MARVRDLWHTEVPDPSDPGRTVKKRTRRHPAEGGNPAAARWQAVWINPEGLERTKVFRTKEGAKSYARDMETDVARREYIDPSAGDARFAEYGQRWLGSRGGNDPASVIKYESVYRLHVEPRFGRRKVGSVRPSEIQHFLTELSERLGPSTVRTSLLVLQGVFDLAAADGRVRRNPAKSEVVRAPDHDDERITAWPDEAVFGVIDAHPDHLRAAPVLGAGCGMRAGEWWGLAAEDVDFEERVIHIRRQVKKLGRDFVFALPKNNAERTVPMPDWVAAYLRAHLDRYPPRPYTLPWERLGGRARTVRLLFRWPGDDRHVRQRGYDEAVWKPALAAAGVIGPPAPVKDAKGKIRMRFTTSRRQGTHQLRHWFASVTLSTGVSVNELAEYLGHSDPAFTLRVYGHMQAGSFDRARQAIDARMARPRLVAGQN